jgi:hypothetical protein
MLEYVYRLNLPSWDQVKRPGVDLEQALNKEYIRAMNPKFWLRPEYQTINGVELTHGVILKKLNRHRSSIHVDNNTMEDTNMIWGINWVIGYGGMEYWNSRDDISEVGYVTDTDNYTRPMLTMKTGPHKNYITVDGGVYLVHASVPHTGYNDTDIPRTAICTRPSRGIWPNDWPTIVSMFSNLIVE